MDNVQDKTVLITGGAGGLGSEFVKIVLENGAKKVAIVDLPTSQNRAKVAEFERKYGKSRVAFFPCDITKVKKYEETFKKIVDAFGYLDILVNNAGMLNDNKLEQTIELNTTSLIRSSLLAMDYMGKHMGGKGGLIINISSIVGLSAQNCMVPIYCATKHAVVGFSQSLANFYHKTGMRIVTLCPGVTATSLVSGSLENAVLDCAKSEIFEKAALLRSQQAPDNVSRAMLHLIQNAENGTVWVCENDQPPYLVDMCHSKQAA
ncbi:15-hydroxyprostaglandin dehydrogenase [NAD(+)] [Harpegnathos saltator]|uniref:15-hydroxyprostaglandin dehydrogenase [NAD+] n=1 Tax=Harpegnathos saltator TaxID=610380 RepID=E2BHN0_HARSA|nr:15-hydroxyprostaglandin dehydrogenase [NAD(+)] [Harpegnathos saltator]EFN84778.1 15-hydroxyprostaglandin dehydrogenase [NAD+] [Harpegnathos saltator]